MARQHNGHRGERFDDDAGGSWLDDRGVSEVIGSILVFGLLVALLAIVQTQAVPNANNEVEVKHSQDVQGDIADLQSAISRTGTFGGTESTTVKTGMSYPPRLVLYNPPAVQGTLAASQGQTVEFQDFSAPESETAEYLTMNPTFESSTVSYRVDYNRYDNAPTTRYEHGAIVDDYEDRLVVESQDTLVSGRYISLTLLGDTLQASQVRPASVTTHPVSAPSQSTTVKTDGTPAQISVPTDLSAEVWVTELLADEIDQQALQGSPITDCDSLNQGGANARTNPADDGNFVVDCDYTENSNAPNTLTLFFEKQETYDLQLSKVAFTSVDEPPPFYVTDVSPENTEDLVVEVRDRYNNPVDRQVTLTLARTDGSGTIESTTQVETGPNGRFEVPAVTQEAFLYLTEGPNSQAAPSAGTTTTCDDLGCATVNPNLPASSLITVKSVSADAAADTITFELDNEGSRNTDISEVQLGYATQRTERQFTVTAGGIVSCSDPTSSSCVSTSLVSDGPDRITDIEVGGTTHSNANGAIENKEPVEFTDTSGNPPELTKGSTSSVVFSLADDDEGDAFTLANQDSVDLSVTVYYDDGSVATYSRTLFDEDGEGT